MNFSSTVLAGHIGKQPELKYTKNGKPVCEFSVATSKGPKDKRVTSWHSVQVWDQLAEAVGQLAKGTAVVVIGEMTTRSWEGSDGKKNYKTYLAANVVAQSLGHRDAPKVADHGGAAQGGSFTQPIDPTFDFNDEPIPF